jgi:tRNA pseudouridine55 synthase
MYSALHHQGQRLYDLARAGRLVEREPRPVTVDALTWAMVDRETIAIDVVCSKGTYIRALARDIGAALGCGAHLAGLERTFVGDFRIEGAVALDRLQADPALLPGLLLPPALAMAGWPIVALDDAQARLARNGMPLDLPALAGDRAQATDSAGALLAVLRYDQGQWRPEKVFR